MEFCRRSWHVLRMDYQIRSAAGPRHSGHTQRKGDPVEATGSLAIESKVERCWFRPHVACTKAAGESGWCRTLSSSRVLQSVSFETSESRPRAWWRDGAVRVVGELLICALDLAPGLAVHGASLNPS